MGQIKEGGTENANKEKDKFVLCEQSSPVQPGKHWQEPSMGLQVPLLVHTQISAQAFPYLPLGHTDGTKTDTTQTQSTAFNPVSHSFNGNHSISVGC